MIRVMGRQKSSLRAQRWIDRAAGVALQLHDENSRYMLGAIIVKGGCVLSVGANRQRNNPHLIPDIPRKYWSFCAEQTALNRLKPGAAKGATIYIARVNDHMETRFAHPCPRCTKMIVEAGITKVCYTGDDGVIHVERIRSFTAMRYAVE